MKFIKFKLCRFVFILVYMLIVPQYMRTQSNDGTINVLFINEATNKAATKAVEVVRTFLVDHQGYNIKLELQEVNVNSSAPRAFLEASCAKIAEGIEQQRVPHLVLDTTKSGLTSETVKSLTHALGLPTVSASYGQVGDLRQWRDLDEAQQKYLLQIMPPADMITEIVRLIGNKMNMSNAAILYDDTFVMDHKYKSMLRNLPIKHIITAVVKGSAAQRSEQIEKLRKLDINNYFILGSLKTIKLVLESVNSTYYSPNFAWHAVTQSFGELSTLKIPNHSKILYVKPTLDTTFQDYWQKLKENYDLSDEPDITLIFYFDLAIRAFTAVRNMRDAGAWPNAMEYLQCEDFVGNNTPSRDIDLRKYFEEVSHSNIFGAFEFGTQSGKAFNGNSYLKFNMDVIILKVNNDRVKGRHVVGNWTAGTNTQLNVNDADVQNVTAEVIYRIYTTVQAPFIIRDRSEPKGYKGFCIDLINEIAHIVDFDYEIVEVEDGQFGSMNEKGEWNGIIRKLIDKEADIGLSSLSVMAEREFVVDFTVPFYDLVGITIMMLKPSVPTSLFKFLTVLETNVWLCILGAYFFTSFLMWVFDRWSPYSYQNNREKYKDDDEKRVFSLKESLWFCMTSLTPQGGGEAPKNLSGRLVAATWWLFGFIIIASYTANLAAFLTVSRLDTPIESLDDLAKQYKILYAPINGSASMQYFQRMAEIENRFYEIWKDMSLNDSLTPIERSKLAVWNYPVSDKYTKMWQAMQEAGLPATLEEAVQRVRSSTAATGFAFLGDATDIRYLVMNNCDLQRVGEEFSRKPYAIAVQQGSHLKDQINSAILALLNKRALEKFKEKWWKNETVLCDKVADETDGISIENIGGVFIVIFIGIGMAAVTLIFEYFWFSNANKWRTVRVQGEQQEQEFNHNTEKQHENILEYGKNNLNYEQGAVAVRSRFNKATNVISPRF